MTVKTKKPKTETFKVSGEDLLKKVKQIIHEGNIRQISIEDKTGKTILILPLTECTIKVERKL